jgi:hypothetical protein
MDDSYVREIVSAANRRPDAMSQREFMAFCIRDLNAGYRAEVERAWKLYSAPKR